MIELAKKEPVAAVVELLEEALAQAKAGDMSYVVLFGVMGSERRFSHAGEVQACDVFFMTEQWKHSYLYALEKEWENG